MVSANDLSRAERKKYQFSAIFSTFFGCVAEQLLDSNSLIILYLITLGGNESFSMFSTSISAVCAFFLIIPCAGLASRIGLRLSYSISCCVSCAAFLLMAAAPLIVPPEYAKYLVIVGCLLYCLMRYPYSVAWYPMLDMILTPEERGGFFGRMRFSYILLNAAIIYGIGKLLGDNPSLHIMQLVIAIAGILALGRKFCMDRMPDNPEAGQNKLDIKKSLSISIRNAPLVGFSFYACFVGVATTSALPLAVIYMKTGLNFNAETIMTITSLYMVGQLTGYALTGVGMRKLGTRWFQIMLHTIFTVTIGGLAMILPTTPHTNIFMAILVWLLGVGNSFLLCLNSTEMLATAKPGNKIMATAFCQTFTNLGNAIGRMGTTMILAAGVLAPEWKLFGLKMSSFNTLFILYFFMIVFFYMLLLLSPSIISKHEDYYNP